MMLQIQIRPYYRHKISMADLKIAADLALKKCQQTEVIVGILITGDAEMHALNRDYRRIDQTTDVLSFNENYIDPESGLEYLGDIIISVPQAKKQALAGGHTVRAGNASFGYTWDTCIFQAMIMIQNQNRKKCGRCKQKFSKKSTIHWQVNFLSG